MTFGRKLKELRQRKGLTLKALADIIGSSKGYLSGIEHGKVNPPSDRFVRRIARAVGLSESELLRLAYYDKVPKEVKTEFRTLAENAESGDRGGAAGLIPLISTEATGYPLDLGDDGLPKARVTEYLRIPGLSGGGLFAVATCDDDMVAPDGSGFRPGDIAVCASGDVRNGDTVFAVFHTREGRAAHLRKVALEGQDNVVLYPLQRSRPTHSLTRDDIDGLFRVVGRVEFLTDTRSGGKDKG